MAETTQADQEAKEITFSTPFPESALYYRPGSNGRNYAYIKGHSFILRLNHCAPDWNWSISSLDWHGDLLLLRGTLTIPGRGSRDGIGVQNFKPGSGEDLIKGASTDALKNAAKLFGVGIELYGPDVEFGEAPTEEELAQQRGNAQQQNRQSPAQRNGNGNGNSQQNGNGQAPPLRRTVSNQATSRIINLLPASSAARS